MLDGSVGVVGLQAGTARWIRELINYSIDELSSEVYMHTHAHSQIGCSKWLSRLEREKKLSNEKSRAERKCH